MQIPRNPVAVNAERPPWPLVFREGGGDLRLDIHGAEHRLEIVGSRPGLPLQGIRRDKFQLLALLLAVALLAALGKFTRPDRTGDYPAAIMVDGTGYLVSVNPLPAGTVDKAEITGCVDSYTGTFPEKDGQQNFSREAALPYAPAEGGLALLHDGAWYLCVPAQVDDDGVLLPGGDRP